MFPNRTASIQAKTENLFVLPNFPPKHQVQTIVSKPPETQVCLRVHRAFTFFQDDIDDARAGFVPIDRTGRAVQNLNPFCLPDGQLGADRHAQGHGRFDRDVIHQDLHILVSGQASHDKGFPLQGIPGLRNANTRRSLEYICQGNKSIAQDILCAKDDRCEGQIIHVLQRSCGRNRHGFFLRKVARQNIALCEPLRGKQQGGVVLSKQANWQKSQEKKESGH